MGSTDLRNAVTGAWVGTFCGLVGAFEMLAENWQTINPAAGTIVVLVWIGLATGLGAFCGAIAGRAFPTLRLGPADGAAFFAAFVVGHLFLPPLVGPGMGVLLLLARRLRRRFLPRHRRLDAAFPLAAALLIATVLLESPRVLPPPGLAPAAIAPGAPLPGSIPVTISIHRAGPFPEVPAVHVPLRELATEEPGALAALWSGRAPARTRSGQDVPRRLAGGGLSRFPPRPIVWTLTALLPRAEESDPPFRTRGTLPEIVAAAGIPVLRAAPSSDDPPLYLRILEDAAPPPADVARGFGEGGAWIDVTLAPDPDGEVAFAGQGVRITPARGPVTLMDVAPTTLHLLGLAVQRDCDGRVLLELLDPAGPGGRAPRYRSLAGPEG